MSAEFGFQQPGNVVEAKAVQPDSFAPDRASAASGASLSTRRWTALNLHCGGWRQFKWVWLFWSDTRERVLMRAVPLPGRTVWH